MQLVRGTDHAALFDDALEDLPLSSRLSLYSNYKNIMLVLFQYCRIYGNANLAA
jgi:hypothetical protein